MSDENAMNDYVSPPKPCCKDGERYLLWEKRPVGRDWRDPKFEWRFCVITVVYDDGGHTTPVDFCPWCGAELLKPKKQKGKRAR